MGSLLGGNSPRVRNRPFVSTANPKYNSEMKHQCAIIFLRWTITEWNSLRITNISFTQFIVDSNGDEANVKRNDATRKRERPFKRRQDPLTRLYSSGDFYSPHPFRDDDYWSWIVAHCWDRVISTDLLPCANPSRFRKLQPPPSSRGSLSVCSRMRGRGIVFIKRHESPKVAAMIPKKTRGSRGRKYVSTVPDVVITAEPSSHHGDLYYEKNLHSYNLTMGNISRACN